MSSSKVITLGGKREEELFRISQKLPLNTFPLSRSSSSSHLIDEVFALTSVLEDFRIEHGFGRAVAAPQIGLHYRIIAINLPASHLVFNSDSVEIQKNSKGTFLMFNPDIYWRSDETFTLWDDCMSFPDLLVRVRRHLSISLKWIDVNGCEHVWDRVPQDVSELLQHEIDHLDGILATSRAASKQDIIQKEDYVKSKAQYDTNVDYVIAPLNP